MPASAKQYQELSSHNDKEDQSAVQQLKLFGKTLLVKGSSSGTSFSTHKAEIVDKIEGGDASFPLKVIPLKLTAEHVSPVDAVAFPWLMLSSCSTQQGLDKKGNLDSNEEREVSSSGSTTVSEREKSSDTDSRGPLLEMRGKNANALASRLSKRAYADSEDCRKGFVPYKRHTRAEKQRSCICL